MLESAQKRVDYHTFATLTMCNHDGMVFYSYDEARCEGEIELKVNAKWGECTKFGGQYAKFYGAAADNSHFAFAGFKF